MSNQRRAGLTGDDLLDDPLSFDADNHLQKSRAAAVEDLKNSKNAYRTGCGMESPGVMCHLQSAVQAVRFWPPFRSSFSTGAVLRSCW